MIQLVDAYKSMLVGRMFPETLLKVLRGEHPLISVKCIRNGIMVFSNGQILKCVGDCYERTDKTKIPEPSANLFLKCRNTRKIFGLSDIGDTSCTACHVHCILLEQQHDFLKRKSKGKR